MDEQLQEIVELFQSMSDDEKAKFLQFAQDVLAQEKEVPNLPR